MTLQEAYEKRRQEVLSLQRQVKKLQKDLEEVSAGLYTPEEKVAFLKQVNSLTHKLKTAEKILSSITKLPKERQEEVKDIMGELIQSSTQAVRDRLSDKI